ncbi:MAG: hypothetical protein H0V26_09765 [Solirubrobacterales bacterium]|nr:hypothetical protein [Solirubrobacterales bacterium]
MPKDTITLRISGDVHLEDYLVAMRQFRALIEALNKEVAGGIEVEWSIEDLAAGSADTTVRGGVKEESWQRAVEDIVRAYEEVGISMERGQDFPYSKEAADAAFGITGILNGRIDEITFETEDMEAFVTSAAASSLNRPVQTPAYSYGAIEGRVQTLSSRTGLRFTLFDAFGRGIQCHLRRGDEDMMRDAWNKWVVVEGRVRRDAEGKPKSIRQITDVVVREVGGSEDYREARGAVPVGPNAPSSEEIIRRLRDA